MDISSKSPGWTRFDLKKKPILYLIHFRLKLDFPDIQLASNMLHHDCRDSLGSGLVV